MARPDGAILDLGIPSNLLATDRVGCRIQKSGRTTGLTTGSIVTVDVTVLVNYGDGRLARFVDQFLVGPGPFSGAGDSGSVIFRDGPSPRAVGLLFAASPWYTIANPIAAVLESVRASMVGAGDGTGDCPEPGGVAAARAAARATKARHEDALLAIPNVRGVAWAATIPSRSTSSGRTPPPAAASRASWTGCPSVSSSAGSSAPRSARSGLGEGSRRVTALRRGVRGSTLRATQSPPPARAPSCYSGGVSNSDARTVRSKSRRAVSTSYCCGMPSSRVPVTWRTSSPNPARTSPAVKLQWP